MKEYKADIYLCLFMLGVLALTFAGHGTSVDENLIIQVVESFVKHGELTCGKMFQALQGSDDKYYSRYGFGYPLSVLPFFLIGGMLDYLFPNSNAFCANPYMFAMLWSSILFTVLTGWIFYRLCLHLNADIRTAAILALGLVFASPFWPYSQTLYRLTASAAVLLLVLLLIFQYKETHSKADLAGIVLLTALGLNIREDLVIALVLMGIYTLIKKNELGGWFCAHALLLGAFLGTILWGLHNYIRFGTFFIENYADLSFNYPLILSLPQLLFGDRRGLIFYAPLALLLPLSILSAKRQAKLDIWLLCAGIIISYLLLYGKSSMWHGGICWGPRHMYFLLPFCLLPGIWWLSESYTKPKITFLSLAFIWGVTVNWPGVYAYQGRFQSFLSSPSFFKLLFKPVTHPEYVAFEDLDLWWIRMIKLDPISLWPLLSIFFSTLTIFWGYKLWLQVKNR